MLRSPFLLASLLAFLGTAHAEDLCGIIGVPTTLTRSKSPYHLRGDLYIAPAARLTLEAGVTIIVESGEACGDTRQLDWADSNLISIKVDGALFINGTADNPVQIAPANHKPGKIQWDGIRIRGKNPVLVQIENLRIAGAQKALFVSTSSFHVANSVFADNNTAIWLEDEANLEIYNNLFTGSRSAAISLRNSNPKIVANIFYRNPNYAIDSDSRPKPRIEYNLFHASGDVHCWRCPVGIGKLSQTNDRGDSCDLRFNLLKDPVFVGSPAELFLQKRDPRHPTSPKDVKDTVLYRLYESAGNQGKNGLSSIPRYTALGNGAWRLSRYSPALDAAPESDFLKDSDGSRGDLGTFGGKPGRTRAKVK